MPHSIIGSGTKLLTERCWPRSMSPYGFSRPQWANWKYLGSSLCFESGNLRWCSRKFPDSNPNKIPITHLTMYTVRASERNFWFQREVWRQKCFFHSFIHFKISASARRDSARAIFRRPVYSCPYQGANVRVSDVSVSEKFGRVISFALHRCYSWWQIVRLADIMVLAAHADVAVQFEIPLWGRGYVAG